VPKRGRFAATPLGDVHLDACEVRSAAGKRHLFLAIDRVTTFADAELHPRTTMAAGATFLRGVIRAFPDAIHTVRTDNGTSFADQPRSRDGPTAVYGGHPFDRVGRAHGVTHTRTRPSHPWTNGQAERLVRTVKDATVKAYHDSTHADLEAHVRAFVAASTFATHRKPLHWRTLFQAVCDAWANDPQPFRLDPHHLIPEPNI
jgi:transposase InsO family protein